MSDREKFYPTGTEAENQALAGSDEMEIDLLELTYRLFEKWKVIAVFALAGLILSFVWTFVICTPTYEATAKLYVLNPSDSAINLSDLQIGSYLTDDYKEVFKTWEVHEQVLANLNLDYTYEELEEMLTVSNPADTRMLYVTCQSADPQEASNIANEYASVAKSYISDKMATEEPSLVSSALIPTEPVSPNITLNLLLGIILGGIIAVIVLVIQFVLDDKIKNAEDIRKYIGLPTLSVVPKTEYSNSSRKITRGRERE